MRTILLIASALAFAFAAADDESALAGLDWLAGCWDGQSTMREAEECWSEPAGGLMLGYGRTVSDLSGSGFEYLRLIERGGEVIYIAQPGGALATEFPATLIEYGFARFSNPEHDYPRVIEYRRDGDQLTAAIGDGPSIEASDSVRRFRFVLRDD